MENEVQTIPSVVNGVIWLDNNGKYDYKYNDSIEDSIISLSQSISKWNRSNCDPLNKLE
jgi:hypothetical protein